MGAWAQKQVGKFVEFKRRKIDSHKLRGFLLAVSDELTLLNVLTDDYEVGGFSIIRNSDVTSYWIYDRSSYFINRALRLKRRRPRARPKVEIDNWPVALVSAQRHFPMITIHPEASDPHVCFIGRIAKLTEKTVLLHEINTTAEWRRPHRHRLADITRLEFGGGYEDALWRVAEEDGEVPPLGI